MDIIISSATQRAGSTLVQRIFNARPKTLIWGEHGGIIKDFIEIHDRVLHFSKASQGEKEEFFGQNKPTNVWTANITPDVSFVEQAAVQSARTFLDTLYQQYRDQHDKIGFKEVRYRADDLRFLRKCYPNAQMVLLTRNPVWTWESMPPEWGISLGEFIQQWKLYTSEYIELAAEDEKVHLITYLDLIYRRPKVIELLAELAEIPSRAIYEVLSEKVGSTQHEISMVDKKTILHTCQPLMEQLNMLVD